jgi:hypothetical protein
MGIDIRRLSADELGLRLLHLRERTGKSWERSRPERESSLVRNQSYDIQSRRNPNKTSSAPASH